MLLWNDRMCCNVDLKWFSNSTHQHCFNILTAWIHKQFYLMWKVCLCCFCGLIKARLCTLKCQLSFQCYPQYLRVCGSLFVPDKPPHTSENNFIYVLFLMQTYLWALGHNLEMWAYLRASLAASFIHSGLLQGLELHIWFGTDFFLFLFFTPVVLCATTLSGICVSSQSQKPGIFQSVRWMCQPLHYKAIILQSRLIKRNKQNVHGI